MKVLDEKIVDRSMGLKKVKFRSKSLIGNFVNNSFYSGKKLRGERALLKALRCVKQETGSLPYETLSHSVSAVRPLVYLKKKKVGGVNYRIPSFLYRTKSDKMGVKWVMSVSKGKKLGKRDHILLSEFKNIQKNKGSALSKRKALNELAILNRAYIKYL